ncbi:MAG: putative endonuclease mitochondrial precursor [Lasallia pustulata]|uniref:Endonuclease n=1 Tax=Lasallia pustulata TaxID=136370 RepID=A0A5M8PQV2_9LECA|nr:MAG: putative endonuclease mitochondrial precursor [Lasallia pustulata]
MSKTTLAIIAACSAASGAAITAAVYSSRPERNLPPTPTTTLPPPTSAPTPASLYPPIPARPLPAKATVAPVDPSGLFQYGFPGPIADLRPNLSTVSAFDRRTRNPHWVAEHITAASLALSNGDRQHSVFVEDVSIPPPFRAKLHDYFRSGYDRGHQVPAADAKWSQEAMDQTFLLSNMCPQVGDGFNRDYWAHLEDFCRRLTNNFPSVRIVTGPLYLPRKDLSDGKWRVSYEVIGNPPNIAVPTHFYKVIFAEDGKTGGDVSLGAFVLPNAPIASHKPLTDFEVRIEDVERASGLEFATKLPPQRRKRLCAEVNCSILVREYNERQKNLRGQPPTSLPAPR